MTDPKVRMKSGEGPAPGPDHFKRLFEDTITSLNGSFSVTKDTSYLLMTFYRIKLKCNTAEFSLETEVIGDEYDEEDDAKENAYQKGFNVLKSWFKGDLGRIAKGEAINQ